MGNPGRKKKEYNLQFQEMSPGLSTWYSLFPLASSWQQDPLPVLAPGRSFCFPILEEVALPEDIDP